MGTGGAARDPVSADGLGRLIAVLKKSVHGDEEVQAGPWGFTVTLSGGGRR
ncbi:MAG: hypothetical protein ACYC3V_21150 [Chloroflexota bacterium]